MSSTARLLLIIAALSLDANAENAPNDIDPAELMRQIQALQQEIKGYKDDLKATEDEAGELETDLETNEKQQNELLRKIRKIEEDLETSRIELRGLQRREAELAVSRDEQGRYLTQQIRAAYSLGNQEYVKVLLNQQDPNEVARMLAYYDYLNAARAEQIGRYRATLAELAKVTRGIEEQSLTLVDLRSDLEVERQLLLEYRVNRAATLARLRESIAETGTAIARRTRDREELEALLTRLSDGFGGLGATDAPFGTLRGALPMPVTGEVVNRFGSQRNSGQLRWNGIFIAADAGQPVRAIHYGRVVFSDWLRGFGLLLIISHGEGYMSLYGHNEVLLRETGEWVTAGEAVAAVGRTGATNRDGLYFEIRSAGKPTDPQTWCRAGNGSRLG